MTWVNDQSPSPGRLGHAVRITRSLWLSSSMETTEIQLRDGCWSINGPADTGTISAAHPGAASVWEVHLSLSTISISSQNSPGILQMWFRTEHILQQNFCIYYTQVFPHVKCFLLAALTWCSLAERKEKNAWRVFTCRYLYVSHTLHTSTSILILCFLHKELDSCYELSEQKKKLLKKIIS